MTDLFVVKNLCKTFQLSRGVSLKAVDNVSFSIKNGEILGLVGESGCGKTTLGRTLKRIYEPDSGEIFFSGGEFGGADISHISGRELKAYTKSAQMIFQDPYSSLNPRMTVAEIVSEGMVIHDIYTKNERRDRTIELLELVGLNSEHANRFPHEFSGGQRQRVGIARALALNPQFIVCDEPISALDVSIQAQIVNLFKRLKEKFSLTYLFVAHDLAMVRYIADRVAVMYLGRIVEIAPARELYENPLHPYTKFLMSAIPIPDPRVEATRVRQKLDGEIASPINLPQGCSFANRCRFADESCLRSAPELKEIFAGHWAACVKN